MPEVKYSEKIIHSFLRGTILSIFPEKDICEKVIVCGVVVPFMCRLYWTEPCQSGKNCGDIGCGFCGKPFGTDAGIF